MDTESVIKALWVCTGKELEATTPHGTYRFKVAAVEDARGTTTLRLEEIK